MPRGLTPPLLAAALAATVALLAAPAHAADPEALDEGEFVRRVEQHDPRFEVFAAEVDGRGAAVTEAEADGRANPLLAYDREEVFASGGALADNFVSLAWPLEVSGRRSRRIAAARLGVDAARAEVAHGGVLLIVDALEIYYGAVHARLRVGLLRESRAELARLVDVVRSRRAAGEAAGYDLDRLELELGAYDDAVLEAELDLAAARRQVAALVGAPTGSIDASAPLDVPAPPAPLQALVAEAVPVRGDTRAATLRAEQAAAEQAAARRRWVPGLTLTGGFKTSDLGSETALGYTVGVAIELPLFERGQGELARAAAQRRAAQAAARSVTRDATLAIALAHDELTRRIGQLSAYRDTQLARLPELLRRVEVAYREGERPLGELLDAYRTAREVRLRELDLRYAAKRAQLALWRALGHR